MSETTNLRVLDAAATAGVLPYAELMEAVEDAAHRLASGAVRAPERTVLSIPGGRYLVMPAVDDRLAVTKMVTVHEANPSRGLPAIHGQVLVCDAVDGRPLMLLDGPTVTARRTAAVSLVGIRALQRETVRRVVIVGAGAQARAHALAVHEMLGAEVVIVTRTRSNGDDLCTYLRGCGVAASVGDDAAGEAAGAQVVITATTSRVPVLPDALDASTLVVGVGAFTPEMAEIPSAMVHQRQVVVDSIGGARHEAGDLLQAHVSWPRVHSLAAVLSGGIAVSGAGPELQHGFVFKTVGHAAWDLAAAGVALEQVERRQG